jgi:heterodisulfide reductase subunit A-like polyferredoxin
LFPDFLVLSSPVIPEENEKTANLFKVQRTAESFYLEAHAKLRPVDFATEGVFMAGICHSPMTTGETIAHASAAAIRASSILSKDKIAVGGSIAKVDKDKCAACLICVRACPFNVPFICEDGYSEISSVQCQGCGTCASECPQKAIEIQHYTDRQIIAKTIASIEAKQ